MVSVIIPTYNHSDFVLKTLASVFAQTFTDYEVIVVNDGSPDGTTRILRPLAEAGRIKYIEQPNAGQAAARNRGLAEAEGEFVAFLDDDDLWPPDSLAQRITAARSAGHPVMVYGFNQFVGDLSADRFPGPDAPTGRVQEAFLRQNWMWSPGQSLMRTEVVRELGGFDTKFWGADDWDLFIRLSGRGEVAFLNECTLLYRKHAGNASKNTLRMYRNLCRVRHKHLGYMPSPRNWGLWWEARNSWASSFALPLRKFAVERFKTGEWLTGILALASATWASPRAVLGQSRIADRLRAARALSVSFRSPPL